MSAGEREARVNDTNGWSDPTPLEPIEASAIPFGERPDSAPDDADDDESVVTLHVTSLRPATRALPLRRLLNVASLVVALMLVLALAIAWLPGVLAQHSGARSTQNTHVASNGIPVARGTGWQDIGPSWAQDISFSADGTVGYVCGTTALGNAPVLVSRLDITTPRLDPWQTFSVPARGNRCQIAISPIDARDVALSVDTCPLPTAAAGNCASGYPLSRLYRSHDGGASWSEVPLPGKLTVNGIVWTNSTLFARVWGKLADDQAATPTGAQVNGSAHVLVSRNDGPFTEISAKQLVGATTRFDYIALFSSGRTLYIALNSMPCSGYCLTVVHSTDNGVHWTGHPASYAGRPITPASAQPNSSALIGWVFRQADQMMVLLQSFDYGEHWQVLPEMPANPSTGGVTVFTTPDGALYAASYGNVSAVYRLAQGASAWDTTAPMPVGMPLAVQYDAAGHAVALWGQAHEWNSGSLSPGLQYYPLPGGAP